MTRARTRRLGHWARVKSVSKDRKRLQKLEALTCHWTQSSRSSRFWSSHYVRLWIAVKCRPIEYPWIQNGTGVMVGLHKPPYSFKHLVNVYKVHLNVSLVLSCVLVPLPLHSHTRLRIAALKKLAIVCAPWRRPFRKNIRTNTLITFDKPSCASLYSTNVSLFVKMT